MAFDAAETILVIDHKPIEQGMVNAIRFGVAEEDAVRAASYNPACAIGAENIVGSIESGKRADFLVCDGEYNTRRVFLAGKEL